MLGPLTQELIETICPPELRPAVSQILSARCSSGLPNIGAGPEWMELIDRIQLAVIRGSGWEPAGMEKAVTLANEDWRDVLMMAGFGQSLSAHRDWQESCLQGGGIPDSSGSG